MSQIYVFLADGFEEVEGLTVVDLLRRAELDVTMVSIMDTVEIIGAHGIVVSADKVFEEVNFDDVDMLVLPGGMPGTKHLASHQGLAEKLKEFENANKMIGAICAGPMVLGMNGILDGKKATCYPGFEDQLKGATVVTQPVVTDENVITSRGVGTAIEFGLAIIEHFLGVDVTKNIKDSIIYE